MCVVISSYGVLQILSTYEWKPMNIFVFKFSLIRSWGGVGQCFEENKKIIFENSFINYVTLMSVRHKFQPGKNIMNSILRVCKPWTRFLQLPPPSWPPGEKIKKQKFLSFDALQRFFEPIFRIFYYNRPTFRENCNFFGRSPTPPPYFKKRDYSHISLILLCKG